MRIAVGRCFLMMLLIAGAGVLSAQVQGLELVPDAPDVYEVRPGDTLWDVAARFLRDPWRWPELWAGGEQPGQAGLIYPGDRLRLSDSGNRPVVLRDDLPATRARGAASGGHADPSSSRMPEVRLSPRVRSTTLEAAVPTIPIASIGPFLTQPRVAESDQIKHAPYVVGFPDDRIVGGLQDVIYVRGIQSFGSNQFQVFRPGDALRDPDTNQILGYEATLVGNATLEQAGDPSVLRLVRVEREVNVGDRVIPAELDVSLEDFIPTPAPAGTRGRIIAVMDGVSQIGQHDVVILNRGARDQIAPGHVLEVNQGGELRRDPVRRGGFEVDWRRESPLSGDFWIGSDRSVVGWREEDPRANAPIPPHPEIRRDRARFVTPFERAGLVLVFRTFDRVSFALVLSAKRAMRVGDLVAPPGS